MYVPTFIISKPTYKIAVETGNQKKLNLSRGDNEYINGQPPIYLMLSKVAAAANEVQKISFLSRSCLYLDCETRCQVGAH